MSFHVHQPTFKNVGTHSSFEDMAHTVTNMDDPLASLLKSGNTTMHSQHQQIMDMIDEDDRFFQK
jgi:hypothetical protein